MPNEYITKSDAITALGVDADVLHHGETQSPRNKINAIPAADVAPVVRLGKDRLTKLSANGIYGLAKVKDNEQEVDSPYRNTLAAIVECFQRLAEYENAEFGTYGGEHHA